MPDFLVLAAFLAVEAVSGGWLRLRAAGCASVWSITSKFFWAFLGAAVVFIGVAFLSPLTFLAVAGCLIGVGCLSEAAGFPGKACFPPLIFLAATGFAAGLTASNSDGWMAGNSFVWEALFGSWFGLCPRSPPRLGRSNE